LSPHLIDIEAKLLTSASYFIGQPDKIQSLFLGWTLVTNMSIKCGDLSPHLIDIEAKLLTSASYFIGQPDKIQSLFLGWTLVTNMSIKCGDLSRFSKSSSLCGKNDFLGGMGFLKLLIDLTAGTLPFLAFNAKKEKVPFPFSK
jgi:hypothetical protein